MKYPLFEKNISAKDIINYEDIIIGLKKFLNIGNFPENIREEFTSRYCDWKGRNIKIFINDDKINTLIYLNAFHKAQYPRMYEILFCSIGTSEDDITLFLNRALLDKNGRDYYLFYPENLDNELQLKVIQHFRNFGCKEFVNYEHSLFVITSTKDFANSEILTFFNKQKQSIQLPK